MGSWAAYRKRNIDAFLTLEAPIFTLPLSILAEDEVRKWVLVQAWLEERYKKLDKAIDGQKNK